MALPKRLFTQEEWQEVQAECDRGLALLPLSRKWTTSRNRMKRLLEAAGREVVARPARGQGHANWVGGRGTDSKGYVWVLVEPNDPLFCMAHSPRRRRVLEHRLVMARKLNRPLREDETVHHIDGDKQNNSINNLQLRRSAHGPGRAAVCLSCGSHNIGNVELA